MELNVRWSLLWAIPILCSSALLSLGIRNRFIKNARGASVIVQTGQIKRQAVAIKNGEMVLNLCFIDSAGWLSSITKNSRCTSAVVIRIHVANVSRAPMAAIRQYFDFRLKSVDTNNQ